MILNLQVVSGTEGAVKAQLEAMTKAKFEQAWAAYEKKGEDPNRLNESWEIISEEVHERSDGLWEGARRVRW